MIQFDESKQSRKYDQLREKEEEDALQNLSQKYGIPYVDLTTTPINTDALILLAESTARTAEVAVFNRLNKEIDVAMHSPEGEAAREVVMDLEARGFSVNTYLASKKSLTFAWDRFKDIQFASESKKGMLDVSSEDINTFIKDVHTVEDVRRFI